MPQFKPNQSQPKYKGSGLVKKERPTAIVESRCHACQHAQRKSIDKLIVRGTNYTEIGRIFEIDRRSIANHSEKHLNYEDAAIQRVMEEEMAEAESSREEGVNNVLRRKTYLEVALKKAMDAVLDDDVLVEPKDAVAIIEKLDKLDERTEGAAIEVLRLQFTSFLQAMKEIVPSDSWDHINVRARELYSIQGGEMKQIEETSSDNSKQE